MPKLAFSMQKQEQTNWCWAAVSASTSSFFGGPSGPSGAPWAQCEIANCALGLTNCCAAASSAPCNIDYYLDNGLTCASHLAGPATSGPSPYPNIKNEIDNHRPVGV